MTPTTTTTEHAVYWYDSKDKSENIFFCIRCDATVSSTQYFKVQSDRGNFELIVTESRGSYRFLIDTASSDYTLFQKYKRCSFKQPQGKNWNQYNLIYLFFEDYYIDADISRAQLQTMDQQHELEFRLISYGGASVSNPTTFEPIYTNVLMDRYFRDKASHDVFFRFDDGPSDDDSKDLCDNDDSKDTANAVEGSILGTHRSIMSQWPYFKTMFKSTFKEGGSGSKKTIRVKYIKPKTFQLMLQFMYMGSLHSTDATLYDDNTTTDDQASWEGLYIAADRYRIDDLRKLALANIEAQLDSTAAIDFLFRSAYLYPELREPVIRYIVKEHHAEILKREIREAHKAHSEFAELLGELYEAFHDLYETSQEMTVKKVCICGRPCVWPRH
ncbi:hypothetical protein BG006_011503 [Podila minutissima]|uniref:BTB domain-containing protein n=1 Tax=Podila minutissima TaxID=64525 RepID=A0A9P5SBV9_9FUNG|nr:hypothetical protein BG006_011503 [Podila minutissima]